MTHPGHLKSRPYKQRAQPKQHVTELQEGMPHLHLSGQYTMGVMRNIARCLIFAFLLTIHTAKAKRFLAMMSSQKFDLLMMEVTNDNKPVVLKRVDFQSSGAVNVDSENFSVDRIAPVKLESISLI